MNIADSFKKVFLQAAILAVGCIMLVLPQMASAGGPPIAFDNFIVDEGIISAPCPAGAVCSNETIDNGMLQRQVFIETGPRAGNYIQFIITEPGVSGNAAADPFSADRGSLNFIHEDFVKMHNRGDGISSRQTLIESSFALPTLEDRFFSTMEYEFGWANSSAFPWVKLEQEISQVDYSLDALNPSEVFKTSAAITSDTVGFNNHLDVNIAQWVDLGDGAQGFQFEKLAGVYQPTAADEDGNVTLLGIIPLHDGPLLPGGSNGGSIAWDSNAMISGLWIGQTQPGAAFGHTAYRNVDEATSTSLTSLVEAEPVNWVVPPFSPLPPLAGLGTVAPTAVVAPPVPLQATVANVPPSGAPTLPVDLPVEFDSWTVAEGVVTTASCPPGVTCGPAIVNEGGIFQRMITIGSDVYIHTVVTDANATGDPALAEFQPGSLPFKTETIVKRGENGLAATMHIAERDLAYMNQPASGSLPTSGGEFVYDVAQKTGWANGGPLDPTITVSQRVTVPDQNYQHTSSVDNVFMLARGATAADQAMHMSSVVGTREGGGSGFNDPIMFYTSKVQGAFQDTTRVLDPFDPLLPGNGGDLAWVPGDAIQATWIGGDYVTPDPVGRSVIGTTSYYNLSTGEHVSSTNLFDPDPESWVDPFEPPLLEYTNLYTP